MIILQSTFQLHPESVDAAIELMREMTRLCRHEHGCRQYSYFQGISDPGEVMLLQEWDDAVCLQGHYETDHMDKFVNKLGPLLRSPITTRSYVSQDEGSVLGVGDERDESTPETHRAIH